MKISEQLKIKLWVGLGIFAFLVAFLGIPIGFLITAGPSKITKCGDDRYVWEKHKDNHYWTQTKIQCSNS